MKNVQKIDLGLTGYDELFANDEERKVNKLPRIFDIPISEIDDFPDHPFKVKIDEDMDQLVQSIKERGIITPVTLRPKEDGRYEIVSGHRRKKACELAGLDTVKAEVREMSRDEAIILMVESNLQRSTILPSEKAFSYKMRLEAMNRQGQRTDLTSVPVAQKSTSREQLGKEVGESQDQVRRYIRLTQLIQPKVTNKSFDNVLKKWNLTVTKQDVETGSAQGGANLAGAKYGIYKGDELIDTYVTDADGKFTTKYYVCGTDWSIKELDSSEGYLVTPGNEQIGVSPKNYTAEYNSEAMKQYEQVKKGNIAIIKHTDDGQTQIETPEEGAEFAVYLKSAGSYDNAKDSERDYLICDENGFAQTKDLPYGRYTVQQTKGWEGRELLKPFDVFVSENGETYRYLINNANFYSYVKVVKIDSTTGKTIPASGIGFHIYDPSGNQIQMTFTYPTVTTIDTFYTDGDGMLITPEKLEYGKGYSLVEVSAPYGYVLNSDPVYFDITEDNSTEENAVTVVIVEKENAPQMGVINVEKTGEYLASVVDTKDSKRLVYAVGGLAGSEYTATAAEDIYTPDGTLRYSKEEVVATLVTKEDGKAVTEPLFLGRYHVVETKAPYGMILNPTVQTVELTYAGQEVEITETSTGFYNERQKVEIDLNKVMEQNEVFGVGSNGEITSVNFGLFAAEEIVAADGSSIPAGWVLEVVECDENGYAAFSTDLPVGAKTYVKEISTDKHYVLSDKEYPVVFEYAGQEVATVHIAVNDGNEIPNELIYGTIKGYKVNRETGDKISGALFGLFRADETSFTEANALLTAESGADGVFTFENVVYGSYTVRELRPAAGYLENETVYAVTVDKDGDVVEITVVNDLIPEIGTTATIDDEKEVCATEVFTLTDTVEYKHLVPGKEYTVKGILMDKATGEPFLQNGEQITSEVTFVPKAPSGSVEVLFTFDAKLIKTDTNIVVFESLYSDSKELTVHADIKDDEQTVTVIVPEIKTEASTDGKKETTIGGEITIEDIVSYHDLTPGKEYVVKGKLEVQKPFPQEDELKTKTARLNELNAMLNLDKRENEIVDGERAEEEPSRSSDDRER